MFEMFSYDVTAAILVSQNNGTAACWCTKPILWELNTFLAQTLSWLLATWGKRSISMEKITFQLLIITNLWLRNGRFTCGGVPLRDFCWVPHSSAPLSSRVFKWQENSRCIEPGICRIVWRRLLLLRERTGRDKERKNISSVPRCSFLVSSLDQSRSQTLFPLPSFSLLQKGKTYCAAFCASLALFAGSGNNIRLMYGPEGNS